MNTENLMTAQELNASLTPEQRRENASKAGQASVEARRRRKTLREIAEILGEKRIAMPMPGGGSEDMSYDVALVQRQYQKAIAEGDTAAAKFIQNLRGEEQIASVSTTVYNVPQDTANAMKAIEKTDL